MKRIITFLIIFITGFNFLYAENNEFGNSGHNKVLSGLGLSLSYVNVLNGFNFDLDSSGTIECWIYPNTAFSTPRTIISKGANTNLSFLFGVNTSSQLYLRIGNTDFTNTGGQTIQLNTWTHVAVTWLGKPSYSVQFYINGNASGTPVVLNAVWVTSNDQIRIGVSQAYPSYSFAGYIDEVKFYKKNITPGTLLANRFCGLGDYYIGAPIDINASNTYKNLLSSWTFNQTGNVAFDYVGNNQGFYMGSSVSFGPVYGHPVPYNFALKFGGGSNDYITIPSSTTFDQNADGSFEFWYRPINLSTEQIIISKATSPSNISFLLGISAAGKLYLSLGNNIALNSDGYSLDINNWNHIVATWYTNSSTYIVTFYKNGKQSGSAVTIPRAYNTNTSPVTIGNSLIMNLPANGYLDEFRLWNNALTPEQILSFMFVSSKAISNTNLLAAYNFDGSLQNFSATTNITGSFNNGNVNYSRYSAYLNDTIPGTFNSNFISHATTINRNNSPNTFPSNFLLSNPFITIPDNNVNGVSDSINYVGPFGNVSGVELFLSIDHSYVGDLIISLTAPNGITKSVLQNITSSGKNILSFFSDGFTESVSSTTYLPPWGFVKPFQPFGNFSSSTVLGYWKIKCVDNVGNDIGVLKGWGLKIDVLTSNGNNQNAVPTEYALYQNYPNPFNPTTKIKFEIPTRSPIGTLVDDNIVLKVFDMLGKEVATLVNETFQPGSYEVTFDGSQFSSGIYFYTLRAGDFTETKKMLLIK